MNWITENWAILVAVFSFVCVFAAGVIYFLRQPSSVQKDKIKSWLLWAVSQAETELGGGTGKLKLVKVYDLFIGRFPKISGIMSFGVFSTLVDEALIEMRKMLEERPEIKNIVETRYSI